MAVVAEMPITEISRRGDTPVAAQEAAGAPPMAIKAGAPPGRGREDMTTPAATKEVVGMSPMVVESRAPPGRDNEDMAAPGPAEGV
jgi:hypothetical protein